MNEKRIINRMKMLANSSSPENLGDNLQSALDLYFKVKSPQAKGEGELVLRDFRTMARTAVVGWRLFENPVLPDRELTTVETIQLIGIELALKEFCYGCEMVDTSAEMTWGNSPPTRFYLNSIYHYASSLFLVDAKRESHKGLPMGGTVVMALEPMGLADLLMPVKDVLDTPFGAESSLGGAILKLRHSYLVHGEFSPKNFEYLIAQTEMRNPLQQFKFSILIWDLYHQTILLDLRITAILSYLDLDIEKLMVDYLSTLKN